jgi:signal transduction histidine kinase
LEFLFKASQRLAASLELAPTMRALAELVVPDFGDGSVVRVVEPGGRQHRFTKASSEMLESWPPECWEWLERATRAELRRALHTRQPQVGSTLRKRRPANMAHRADLSYIVVPLRVGSQPLGTLIVFSFATRQPSLANDLVVGEALGTQAGFALEHAHLYEEQRKMVERLELVRGQLDSGQDAWLRDDERRRIARDLHDDVEQTFFAIGLTASTALDPRLGQGSSGVLSDALARTVDLANSGAEQLRTAIFALNHAEFAGDGLIPTLFKLVRSFHLRTGIEADLVLTGRQRHVPSRVGEALYAMAREALVNVERHARAGAVVLGLDIAQSSITLSVHDDGAGASPLVLKRIANSATHFGLRGLRDRVQHLKGTFVAGPGPDGGFLVRAQIPLKARARA